MQDKLVQFRLVIIALLGVFGIAVAAVPAISTGQLAALFGSGTSGSHGQYLTVAFMDIGQGDAIYIETPDGVQVLIDGGPDSAVLRTLPPLMPFLDRSIDVVLATHPDKDHIGGLVDVLERYKVGEIIMTENENDTGVSSAFIDRVQHEGAELLFARAGQVLQLGASTTLTIYSPAADPSALESNASSIVAQLKYGDSEFMLTGDAPIGIEEYLVKTYGTALSSDVLKLGHHGSKTSSSAEFLAAVHPEYAVVSAGKDNRYGHPTTEALGRATAEGSKILSTIDSGTIIFKSDGQRMWTE